MSAAATMPWPAGVRSTPEPIHQADDDCLQLRPLFETDLDHHLAAKQAFDAAAIEAGDAAVGLAPISRPEVPRHETKRGYRIGYSDGRTVGESAGKAEGYQRGYVSGWRWGLLDGLLCGAVLTALCFAFGHGLIQF